MMDAMLRFIKHTAVDDPRLPANPTELGLLPEEQFAHLEFPFSDFPEADVFQIHRARWTGTKTFRNGYARNDWIWVQTGREESNWDLRGGAVLPLLALF